MKNNCKFSDPSILEFAQLALDVYDDPKDDPYRSKFSKLWLKKETFIAEKTGISEKIYEKIHKSRQSQISKKIKDVINLENVIKIRDALWGFLIPMEYFEIYKMYVSGKMLDILDKNIMIEKTGLFARVYHKIGTSYSVLAIRGTEGTLNDLSEDSYFMTNSILGTNINLDQVAYLVNFIHEIMQKKEYSNRPIKFLCGHSLGGIIAKLVATITGLHTCAFNSPGVLKWLQMKGWNVPTNSSSTIIKTYVVNHDEVGETFANFDIGERITLATTSNNTISCENLFSNKIDFNLLSTYAKCDNIIIKSLHNYLTTKKIMGYHSMATLFDYMYQNNYENVFLLNNRIYARKQKKYIHLCHYNKRNIFSKP